MMIKELTEISVNKLVGRTIPGRAVAAAPNVDSITECQPVSGVRIRARMSRNELSLRSRET
jgi:hypothetical protein